MCVVNQSGSPPVNQPFTPDLAHLTPNAHDPFACFTPFISIGHLIVAIGIDIDNARITVR
jgi:hypothetical protein